MISFLLAYIIVCAFSSDEEEIVVHFVPHSHIDLGWLQTYDEYYESDIRQIILNVLQSISEDNTRRFVFSETSYIERFFTDTEVKADRKDLFRDFLESGFIEIAGGWWAMCDESITTATSISESIFRGLDYIRREFGEKHVPQYQWRIDPFGHSDVLTEFGALAGQKYAVLHRIGKDHADVLREDKHFDFIWETERSQMRVLSTVLDVQYCFGEAFFRPYENVVSEDNANFERFIDKFMEHIRLRKRGHPTKHVLFTYGCDHSFRQTAPGEHDKRYRQLEAVMRHINGRSDVDWELKYSLPMEYFREVEEEVEYVHQGDFLTYTDDEIDWWTGYFSSYPIIKELQTRAGGVLRALNIFSAFTTNTGSTDDDVNGSIDFLSDVYAWITHHDAVTGTSKPFVMTDYLDYMRRAISRGEEALGKILLEFMNLSSVFEEEKSIVRRTSSIEHLDFVTIQKGGMVLPLILANSLPWERKEIVSIKVPPFLPLCVSAAVDGSHIRSQIYSNTLSIEVTLPPIGYTTVLISLCSDEDKKSSSRPFLLTSEFDSKTDFAVFDQFFYNKENRVWAFAFEENDNNIIGQVYEEYTSESSSYNGHNSGAYVFQPHSQTKSPAESENMYFVASQGELYPQVFVRVNGYIQQVTRFMDGFVQIEHSSGVPPSNIEMVTSFVTQLDNNKAITFSLNDFKSKTIAYRDSKPIEGNYWPMVHSSSISDADGSHTVTIVSSQAHSIASVVNGEITVMLHRRPSRDDWKGLNGGLTLVGPNDYAYGTMSILYDYNECETEKFVKETMYPIEVFSPDLFLTKQEVDEKLRAEETFLEMSLIDESFGLENGFLEWVQSSFPENSHLNGKAMVRVNTKVCPDSNFELPKLFKALGRNMDLIYDADLSGKQIGVSDNENVMRTFVASVPDVFSMQEKKAKAGKSSTREEEEEKEEEPEKEEEVKSKSPPKLLTIIGMLVIACALGGCGVVICVGMLIRKNLVTFSSSSTDDNEDVKWAVLHDNDDSDDVGEEKPEEKKE